MAEFRFKQFSVDDQGCGMKIGTDSVLLGCWARIGTSGPSLSIIDLGAGCGLLALMCAQRWPSAKIAAVEIDPMAAKAASSNFKASPWSSRLEIANADALQYVPADKADLIICNPPYFHHGAVAPDESRARSRHIANKASLSPETALALASKWLKPEGILAMVTPALYLQSLVPEAEMLRLKLRRLCQVRTSAKGNADPSLLLWQFSPTDGKIEREEISLRNSDNTLTQEYQVLTQDFYLDRT